MKRFGQVIIGACFQPYFPVLIRRLCGEHEDGKTHVGFADGAGHFQSAHFGKHEVKDDQVEIFFPQLIKRRHSVVDQENFVPFPAKVKQKSFRQMRVIFN